MTRMTEACLQNMEAALKTWLWDDVDQELFVKQFQRLNIIKNYKRVKQRLAGRGLCGVFGMLRAERELLLKVCPVISWPVY